MQSQFGSTTPLSIMPIYYRRCESCGSKALATATRCPRCELAFELNDSRGKRHRLIPCRSCNIVQPSTATECRWCGDKLATKRFSGRSVITAATAVAAVVLLFVSRNAIVTSFQSALSGDTQKAAPAVPVDMPQSSHSPSIAVASALQQSVDSVPVIAVQQDSATSHVADQYRVSQVTDSIQPWEEAKALTWVNVRADRSRDATIVAVVNPDDVVRLGANSAGWRRVSVDGAIGWVDGRHFTTPGQN